MVSIGLWFYCKGAAREIKRPRIFCWTCQRRSKGSFTRSRNLFRICLAYESCNSCGNWPMNAELIGVITFGLLALAIVAGMRFSEERFGKNPKATVKLAVNLVATMSALVLGLLVSSAKASYDTVRSEVIDMSAKAVFLDRVLAIYGPESDQARARLPH